MTRSSFLLLTVGLTVAAAWGGTANAQQPAPDRILVNGKILTVDRDFSIAQAVAISGERILAVGTNQNIGDLAGPDTLITDLGGRTVIPGLIDNHVHYLRGVATWPLEARLDAVSSRATALELIAAKARASEPGQWVLTIGGWNESQFADVAQLFTKDELDRAAPDNPVFVQVGFGLGLANSLALEAAGIDRNSEVEGGERRGPGFGQGGSIVKDQDGNPTGVLRGSAAIAMVRNAVPTPDAAQWKANLAVNNADYNRAGITTVYDAGGFFPAAHYGWARDYVEEQGGWSSVRIFHMLRNPFFGPGQASQAADFVSAAAHAAPNDYFRQQGLGEVLHRPVFDIIGPPWRASEQDLTEFGKIVTAAAEGGWQIHEHTMIEAKFNRLLDMFQDINRSHEITGLRWSFHHGYAMTDEQMERANELGMVLALHTTSTLLGSRWMQATGAEVLEMPPFRSAQRSGIPWGLGTDAGIVSPYQAFFTLYFAVTGKDAAGRVILKDQTVTREEALIAHTRSNAHLLFQEDNLGTIEPGKYADLVVLDRDYLTVPEDEIKDIRSVLTLVGGRVGAGEPDDLVP